MNLTDLLADLSARGARVWAEDGQLRLRAPKGALTLEIQGALSKHKAELLELLGEQSAGLQESRPLEPRAGAGPARLSVMQERLWFLWQMYPQSAVYNLPNARRMRGPVDVDALRAAVAEIIQRHEALRTVCEVVGGELQQRIVDRPEVLFEVVDISS
ncbi:MAG: condensation domain-containing protein, partial [Longimicrobiales bacterium]